MAELSLSMFSNRFLNINDSISSHMCVKKQIEFQNLSSEVKNIYNLLNLVAASFGTVLQKYIGNETVSFILRVPTTEQDCTDQNATSTEFKFVQINFDSKSATFDDLLKQVKNCSKVISYSDLENIASDVIGSIVNFEIKTSVDGSNVVYCASKLNHLCQIYIDVEIDSKTEVLRLNFNSTKFEKTKLQRLACHVTNILKQATQQSKLPLSEIRLLGADEEHNVLHEFNQLLKTTPEFWNTDTNLFEIFYKNVIENGSKLAIVQQINDYEICLTYSELFAKVTFLAGALKQMRPSDQSSFATPNVSNSENFTADLELVAPQLHSKLENKCKTTNLHSFVAILLPQSLSFVVSSLSILMIGKTVAPLHHSYALEQVESCIAVLEHPVLVTTKAKVDEMGLIYDKILLIIEDGSIDYDGKQPGQESLPNHVTHEAKFNKTPYCFFTSGSTGQPKAALVNQATVFNEANFAKERNILDSSTRTMAIASPGFIPSLYDPWIAWLVGGSLYIPSEETKTNPKKLLPWIYHQEITCFFASTVVAEQLLNTNEDEESYLSKLKFITLAGGRLNSLDLRNRIFHCEYLYGSTETYGICFKNLAHGKLHENFSVGVSMPNVNVYVLDPFDKPVPIGVTGEVHVSGVGVMAGYLNRSDSGLVQNPFENGSMFRTGDIGYFDEGGELWLQGRSDQQVKIHGMRLELAEVESVLQNFPGISQAVVQIRTFENTQNLVAYVKPNNPEKCPTEAEIKLFLKSRLQRHAIPAEIKFVEAFALTPSGKLYRNGPIKLLAEQSLVKVRETSNTFLEIRHILANTLGVPQEIINVDSDFFSLGGNSMFASKLTHELCSKFPKVQLSTIYQFPVISNLIKFLDTDNLERTTIDFKQEIKFDIRLGDSMRVPTTIEKSVLTGAAGYFGSALLIQLLTTTAQNVVCIVRAPNLAEAEKKLEAALLRNKFILTFQDLNGRLQVVVGDLKLPLFGLLESTYNELSATADAIYHAAAEVNHLNTYDQLKESTKAMTKNVIKFATHGKLKWIHHVSTLAVFDRMFGAESEQFTGEEDFLKKDVNPEHMRNGYAQSKWVSEGLMRNASDAGIPVAIYRLGQIGCHSSQPIINLENSLASFLKICKKLGCIPSVNFSIPYARLDYAVETVAEHAEKLMENTLTEGRVLHVFEAHMSLEDFVMSDQEGNYKTLSLTSWVSKFNSQQRRHTNEEVGTLAFLNYIDGCSDKELIADSRTKIDVSLRIESSSSKASCKSELALNYMTNLFRTGNLN